MASSALYSCLVCKAIFETKRSLSLHLTNSDYCVTFFNDFQYQIQTQKPIKKDITTNNNLDNSKQSLDIEMQTSIDFEDQQSITSDNGPDQESISEHSQSESNLLHFDSGIAHEIKLMKLINELGTPLYAYKKILDWAKEAQVTGFNFESQHGTYQQTMIFLEHKLHLGISWPKLFPVTLHKDNMQIDVVVFDVKKMLLSLFEDTKLNQNDNLVVNKNDFFSKYVSPKNKLGEVNSGKWYQVAYDNCINNPETNFLCPIILASDKTTISEMGDLHVDAIFMTTSLFDLKVSFCVSS